MSNLTDLLSTHHKQCDELFADAESAAQDRRWQDCDETFRRFNAELEAHFLTEERVVFPAFEAATGMTAGPTQVMRTEHEQMRRLLAQLAAARGARDPSGFAGASETLLILMQQHNMKEENILYPMCDRSLDASALDVAGQLQAQREAVCRG